MAISLIMEVLDHAPENLSSGERLVLIVIAEWANERTREARQTTNWTLDTVMHRSKLRKTGLKSALQGLAAKGCEVRKPLRWKDDSTPVFAYEGMQMTFLLPTFRDGTVVRNVNYHEDDERRKDPPAERGGHSNPSRREGMPEHPSGVATASERGGHSNPHPFSPLKNPSSLSPDDAGTPAAQERERDQAPPNLNPEPRPAASPGHHALATRNITGAEADRLIPVAEAQNNVRKPRAWWPFITANGTLDGVIADARAAGATAGAGGSTEDQVLADFATARKNAPPCQHDRPGGNLIHPVSGKPHCTDCRHAHNLALTPGRTAT